MTAQTEPATGDKSTAHERLAQEIEDAVRLTKLMADHQAQISAIGAKRGKLLLELRREGVQIRYLAERMGLSEAQVHKMLKRERDR